MNDKNDRDDDGNSEQREVDEILAFVRDRTLWKPLLQFSCGHQPACDGERADDRFHAENGHHEARHGHFARQIKFSSSHERYAKSAERVAERCSLGNGGHLYFAKWDADDGTEDESYHDEF